MAPMLESCSFALNRNFALACNDHIQQQRVQYRWVGLLDSELLGLAFQKGAEWQFRNQSKTTCSEDLREA